MHKLVCFIAAASERANQGGADGPHAIIQCRGEMAEWSKAPDSKSGLGQPNGGSNPSLSASFVSPKVARAVATDASGPIVIERSYDQHFYVQGAINGHPVTFMADTGATVVSVNE